jgi:hypothetical protein
MPYAEPTRAGTMRIVGSVDCVKSSGLNQASMTGWMVSLVTGLAGEDSVSGRQVFRNFAAAVGLCHLEIAREDRWEDAATLALCPLRGCESQARERFSRASVCANAKGQLARRMSVGTATRIEAVFMTDESIHARLVPAPFSRGDGPVTSKPRSTIKAALSNHSAPQSSGIHS